MPESYSNDDGIAEVSVLLNKAKLMDGSLDFSLVKVRHKLNCNFSLFAFKMPIFICDVEIVFCKNV